MEKSEYPPYPPHFLWWDDEDAPEPREFLVTEETVENFEWEEEDEDDEDISFFV